MAEEKNYYELMIVVAPQLMEQKNNPKEMVEGLINKGKGEILDVDDWGEKTLAYAVDGHEKGYYLVYKLAMTPSALKKFKSKIRLEKGLLRWLISRSEN